MRAQVSSSIFPSAWQVEGLPIRLEVDGTNSYDANRSSVADLGCLSRILDPTTEKEGGKYLSFL
jgi:hypothetical protein